MTVYQIVWLIVFVLFLAVEGATVGLVSIWFAGGALVALLLASLGANMIWQVVAFLVVSLALLVVTRPLANKYFNAKKEKTNYEGVIGKIARVTEEVDNLNGTGRAVVDGQDWKACAAEDGKKFEAGRTVKVVGIKGVTLVLAMDEE